MSEGAALMAIDIAAFFAAQSTVGALSPGASWNLDNLEKIGPKSVSNHPQILEKSCRKYGKNREKSGKSFPMRSRTDSFSISQAARRLGLSEKSVRQLCDEGRLTCSYTSGGHRRIPREAVEAFRRQGPSGQGRPDPGASGVSSVLQDRRESLEQKRLTLAEIDLDDSLEQKRAEHAEKKAAREAVARAPELERQHEAERRRFEERQRAERADEERRRREWTDRWIDYGLRLLPQEAPHTLELDLHHEVGKTLAKLSPEQPGHLVQRLVTAAVEKALGPSRRQHQIETILEESLKKHVPWGKRRTFDSLPRTESETRAYEAADAAIEPLRASGSLAQIQATAEKAVKSTVQELQQHEDCNDILRGVTLWDGTSEEQEAAKQAVTAALEKLPIGCGRGEMERAREQAMSRFKKAIADRKAAEAAATHQAIEHERREQLVASATYALPWGATDVEKAAAAAAVRGALAKVPLRASQTEVQSAMAGALAPIKEGIEERSATQRQQAQRQRAKSALITFAVFYASNYLDELDNDGDIELEPGEDFDDVRRDFEAMVRNALEQKLTGDETQDQANRLARELVDEDLE